MQIRFLRFECFIYTSSKTLRLNVWNIRSLIRRQTRIKCKIWTFHVLFIKRSKISLKWWFVHGLTICCEPSWTLYAKHLLGPLYIHLIRSILNILAQDLVGLLCDRTLLQKHPSQFDCKSFWHILKLQWDFMLGFNMAFGANIHCNLFTIQVWLLNW